MANVQFITKECIGCHKREIINLTESDFLRWRNGELVQNVWPQFTNAERELLVTGIHSVCWNAMFLEEED